MKFFFFFQAEDGIRDGTVTGVQTCALPILVGNGINGPGTWIRDVRIGARYPEGSSPDPHNSGLILAGAMWDFRTATVGYAPLLARTLMQLAKYGLPDDVDDGVAMSEFFIDM